MCGRDVSLTRPDLAQLVEHLTVVVKGNQGSLWNPPQKGFLFWISDCHWFDSSNPEFHFKSRFDMKKRRVLKGTLVPFKIQAHVS